MPTQSRNVEHFLVYELIQIVTHKADEKGNVRIEHVPVAVFDNDEFLNPYVVCRKQHEPDFEHKVNEEWVSVKPVAENFSLPFNPVYALPEGTK